MKKLLCIYLFLFNFLWSQEVLIVDYMMSDPILYQQLLQKLPQHGIKISYRRYYPGFVKSDQKYKMLIVATSRFPFPSPEKMSIAERDFLTQYVQKGGILISLYSGEENDRIARDGKYRKMARSRSSRYST